jgi:fructosamine-3-kinase
VTSPDLTSRVESARGRRVVEWQSLAGGCVGDVRVARFDDGSRCVAKLAPRGGLAIEGWMLDYLAANSRLPVPKVLHAEEQLLLLELVDNDGGRPNAAGELAVADRLADLHSVTSADFGLERDTVIAALPQPNGRCGLWVEFFRDYRLACMGRRALDAGGITAATFGRLERLCDRLADFVAEPAAPSLVHGDVWSGNVLVRGGEVVAFIDPAIYYADAEVELAFISLFSTFGERFYSRYRERRGLSADFFTTRCELYNLYPLLVHATLFGGGYGTSVARSLARYVD